MNGYIWLHRKMVAWDWYKDSDTKSVFLHLLLKAYRKPKLSHGVMIGRGQLRTGRKKLSEELGISEQRIRTCLKRLQSTNECTITSTKHFSIVTIVNYNKYQSKALDHQPSNQPTKRLQLTTNGEVKKKEVKKKKKDIDQNEKNFDLFWAEYPRKVGKKIVLAKWKRLKLGNGPFPEIMEALAAVKTTEQWEDLQFVPHPSTWLNQERWKDEIVPVEQTKCKRCSYYNQGKCANLSKEGFNVNKCSSFISIEKHK